MPHVVLDKGFIAGEAINQFDLVKLVSAETINKADTDNEAILGVAQETATSDDATAGRVINVRLLGVSRVIADADLTIYTNVVSHDDGSVKAMAAATKQKVVGLLLTDPAAQGDHADILLTPGVEVDNS